MNRAERRKAEREARKRHGISCGHAHHHNYGLMTTEQLVEEFNKRANKHSAEVVRACCVLNSEEVIQQEIDGVGLVITEINMLLYHIERRHLISLLKADDIDFKDFLSLCVAVRYDILAGKTELDLTEKPCILFGIEQQYYSRIDKYHINRYDKGVYEAEKTILPLLFRCYQKIGPGIAFIVSPLEEQENTK